MRRFLLRGSEDDLEKALDRCHLHATVLGVVERDGEVELWLEEDLSVVGALEQVSAVELPVDARRWTGLEQDQAIEVLPGLLVRPPWVPAPAGFAGVDLVVPRGDAFGSGEHGSTRAALRVLHALWTGAERSFADVGTGSGILALYGRARGVPRLLACDVDAAAVAAARELLPGATVVAGGAEQLPAQADVVVANLSGTELRDALPAILRAWNRHAALVLSGMRADEVAPVLDLVGLAPVERAEVDGFHALGFRDPVGPVRGARPRP
jgi:ribosomal protein L11 methyltransferase